MDQITFDEFEKVELCVGTILRAEPNEKAKKPSYKLWVDFGSFGVRTSSAQITEHYTCEDLIGTKVIAVLNFAPRNIAGFESQVLVCGFADPDGCVVLARPDKEVPNGSKLF